MNLENKEIAKIIARFIQGDYSEVDKAVIDNWVSKSPNNQKIINDLMDSRKLEQDLIDYNSFDKEVAWKNFEAKHYPKSNIFYLFSNKIIWTASILMLTLGIFYLVYQNRLHSDDTIEKIVEGKILKDSVGEILPATTGAFLISSNGDKVELNTSFEINADGEVIISDGDKNLHNSKEEEIVEYELVVPKAKVIHFTLFDGSKVWVNANSRLKIPSRVNNDERRIKLLSGEVYLEVEKYNNSKFIVETQYGEVEVLGTKFNVNSSSNSFKTTLVEGSVKLISDNHQSLLTPNNSGTLYNGTFLIRKANLDSDLAWKNNVFYFNNFTINRIAEQIENWYGVKVKIENNVSKSKQTYSGEIRRDVKLTEMQKMLEFISGLDINIEGENLNIE